MPIAMALVAPVSAHNEDASKVSPDVVAIDALGPHDVWTVGAHYVGYYRPRSTVAQHWDGQTWTTVETPNPGRGQNALYAASGTGSDDVWAVGYFWNNTGGPEKLLAEHWDGSAWSVVHVEQPDFTEHHHSRCELYDVVAIAPDDAWAVGFTFNGGPGALTEHWDGSRWSIVDSPHDVLQPTAVAASGPDDVWVGTFAQSSSHAITWHWNGAAWQSIPGPTIRGARDVSLTDVVALSPNDAWAAGDWDDDTATDHALLLHWDGEAWKVQHPPHPQQVWEAVSGTSGTDVWVAGSTVDYPTTETTVIDHWDGMQWTTVKIPLPMRRADLYDLSADSADDVWELVQHGFGDRAQKMVGHWDGTRWRLQK
jgi:hypothetical protein